MWRLKKTSSDRPGNDNAIVSAEVRAVGVKYKGSGITDHWDGQ